MSTATQSDTLATWVALYRGYSAVFAVVERALVLRLDMSLAQFHSLLYLRESSPCRNTDLAGYLLRQAQTVTGVIDRLEGKKWAVRERHPTDRRAIQLRITPSGQKALEEAIPIVEEALPAAVSELSQGERSMLIRLAGRLERVASRRA
jgi:DNA-binding MarR family transcriptional regulator